MSRASAERCRGCVNGGNVHLHVAVAVKVHDYVDDHDHDHDHVDVKAPSVEPQANARDLEHARKLVLALS